MYDPENAYHWLSREIHTFPYTLQVLVTNMHAEVEAGNFSLAWQYMQALKTNGELSDLYERALMLMQCALAACRMHHPTQSVQDLREAIRVLDQPNARDPFRRDAQALAYWMLGNLTLPFSNTPRNLTTTWETSLQTFEELGSQLDTFKSLRQWYQERGAEMRQGIIDAITWRSGGPFLQRASLFCGTLGALEVYDYAPAGAFRASQAVSQVRLQPANESFEISSQRHVLYNLRGTRRLIVLDAKKDYLVLRVSDDSMDKVGLGEGDYVLIRRQDWAETGDMVMLQPNRDDRLPTLRTYLKKEARAIFQPQSSNPEHATFEIEPESDDGGEAYTEVKILPQLLGVVLGVFKVAEAVQTERQISPARQDLSSEPTYPGDEILSILPIFAAIRAGKATPVPERTDSMLESHRFWIDGKPYGLKNLRGSKRTATLGSGKSIILKVHGDSMNQAGIQDSDYVLLRLQSSAASGDIVAAVIKDVDELATLKRYETRGKDVVLKPESSNPQHQEYSFNASSPDDKDDRQPFHIAGIVIAVLKPQA